jgi:hypothetical protein
MIKWGGRLAWVVWGLMFLIVAVQLVLSGYTPSPLYVYLVGGLSIVVFLITTLSKLRTQVMPTVTRFLRIVSEVSRFSSVGMTVSVVIGIYYRLFGIATAAPPPFITDVTQRSQFDSVLAYARRLGYDSTTHNAPDSTLIVDTVGGSVHITRAWIAPAAGANNVPQHELYGTGPGMGRVVARIRVDTTYGHRGYPELHLPAGVSYIWVDSLELRDTTGTFRAFVIPDPGDSVIRLPALHSHYYRSRRAFSNFAMARWVLYGSNCTNVPCGHGCCQSCP